jgi:hypothetical protein
MPTLNASHGCHYCSTSHVTDTNYGETRRINLPDGGWVHYGCFRHWLMDDALSRHFPGLQPAERDVLKMRMDVPVAGSPRLRSLADVGSALGWTRGMRASQVQLDAWHRYTSRNRALKDAAAREEQSCAQLAESDQRLEDAAEAARAFITAAQAYRSPSS